MATSHMTVKKHPLTLPAPGPVILRIVGRSLIRKYHKKGGLDVCTVCAAEGCVEGGGVWSLSFACMSPEEQAKAQTAQPPVSLCLHIEFSFSVSFSSDKPPLKATCALKAFGMFNEQKKIKFV